MTMRETLIDLLDEVHRKPLGKKYRERLGTIADYLIANGVTIPKTGHWIIRITSDDILAECSECRVCGNPKWNVCPVCERKMEVNNG